MQGSIWCTSGFVVVVSVVVVVAVANVVVLGDNECGIFFLWFCVSEFHVMRQMKSSDGEVISGYS